MADLLPEGSISQIKAKLVRMSFSFKKRYKTHEIDSKEIKKQKDMYFWSFPIKNKKSNKNKKNLDTVVMKK